MRPSPPRRAVRRRLALLWGGGLVLCLLPIALAFSLRVGMAFRHGRIDAHLPVRLVLGIAGGAAAAWVIGLWLSDRSLGPTLDRLHEMAEGAAELALPDELVPALRSAHLTSAFGQLAARLQEADVRLRAQIAELERARAELLRSERLATIGRLAAGIGHEIGNPLGALLGFVDIGEQEGSGAVLPAIRAEALRIHRTVQELMDFARPGKMELAPASLQRSLDAALRLVRAHPKWRSMKTILELQQGLPPVRASEHHLVQVLVNLLLNAADACGGEWTVTVRAASEVGRVVAWVADDGPGLPEGAEEQLFEPFFTTKARGEGTGLGLAVCRRLMEGFGGEIRAERADRGASFRLVFSSAGAPGEAAA